MTWQDSDREIEIDAPDEPEYREEDYSPLGPKKKPLGNAFQIPDWPFRWILVGFVSVIVLVLFIFSGSDSSEPSQRLKSLEKRIIQLESQLASLEPGTGQGASVGTDKQKIEQYMGRFDRFEVATTKRMDYLTKRIDTLNKKAPAKVPPVTKRPTTDDSAAKAEAQFHLVSKGETLYSISRAYGLSLNELRRLNKLDDKASIYPGQKLKIK